MKNITYTQFKKQLPSLIRDKDNLKYNAAVSADEKKRKKKIVVMDYDLYKSYGWLYWRIGVPNKA